MVARIRKLPPRVIDRIAAGEVVERPASIVKELVENALDAGATRIDVEVRSGGRDLVVVRDDGIGMGADDLRLALVSHATSKLADVGDLDHIASFGFRGEALASMGAVADCRIVSREQGASHGHAIESRGGEIGDVEEAAAPPGTRVEVRNLFRYVPARRKFLRAPGTEMSHVTAALHRLAIANPHVAFSLARDGRDVVRVSASDDRRSRIARFYGRQLFEALLPVSGEERGLRLEGFVAPPSLARRTSAWMQIYLNGRTIRDRRLAHALRHAYEGLLTRGQQPVAFVFLEMDPECVDVNVHPAKTEVRFQDGDAVHRLVRRGVRSALLGADLAPEIVPDALAGSTAGTSPQTSHREAVGEALAAFLHGPSASPPAGPTLYGAATPRPHTPISSGSPPPTSSAPAPRAAGRYLQVRNTFLVFEVEGGIAIVDQHALHERIQLEALTERVRDGSLEVQPLLVPAVVELPGSDVEAVLAEREALAGIGVRLDRFGETAIAVSALPALLSRRDPATVVRGLAERITAGKGAGTREQLLDELLHSMACRSAIMAGDPITEEQAAELMRRADLIDNPHGCAHGRPTVLRVSFRELWRHFQR